MKCLGRTRQGGVNWPRTGRRMGWRDDMVTFKLGFDGGGDRGEAGIQVRPFQGEELAWNWMVCSGKGQASSGEGAGCGQTGG